MCDNRDKAGHLRQLIEELKAWMRGRGKNHIVTPAQAGVQQSWVPGFRPSPE